jgi:L-ribulose-5-phosphate 4-epimerase
MLEDLKNEVLHANMDIVKYGLVTLTWGNVSGISRSEGIVAIKPSGVEYGSLTVNDIVLVDMDGRVVEGTLRPSSDTPTHCALYAAFPGIGGITHTHSLYSTVFAQACCEIPCYGTTHADGFHGAIPVTRFLTEEDVAGEYEKNTGKIIAERFTGVDPMSIPGVLVAGHAPFCWGKDARDSVRTGMIMERVAQMAYLTLQLRPEAKELPDYFIQKHYFRKHGPEAYYGQK